MKKIIITGLEEFGIADGEYELEPGPTHPEFNRFRKDAGLSPSELTDAMRNGGIEAALLAVYVVLERAGLDATAVFNVPLDRLNGVEVEMNDEEEKIDPSLPPTSGLASNGSEPESEKLGGTNTSRSSVLSG